MKELIEAIMSSADFDPGIFPAKKLEDLDIQFRNFFKQKYPDDQNSEQQ